MNQNDRIKFDSLMERAAKTIEEGKKFLNTHGRSCSGCSHEHKYNMPEYNLHRDLVTIQGKLRGALGRLDEKRGIPLPPFEPNTTIRGR